jgi:hypothetical protein
MAFPVRSSVSLFAAICLSLSTRTQASSSQISSGADISEKILVLRKVTSRVPNVNHPYVIQPQFWRATRANGGCYSGYWRNC